MQYLLDGLCDRETQWCAGRVAKGIGRLTMNLDEQDADDVIAATLDTFTHSSPTDDAAWHGACLAVAELSRRGLLLPARLSAVLPFTLRASVIRCSRVDSQCRLTRPRRRLLCHLGIRSSIRTSRPEPIRRRNWPLDCCCWQCTTER